MGGFPDSVSSLPEKRQLKSGEQRRLSGETGHRGGGGRGQGHPAAPGGAQEKTPEPREGRGRAASGGSAPRETGGGGR